MSEYLVGIDLGTTHTVVAYTEIAAQAAGDVRVFPIPQLVAAGEIAAKPLLSSACYLYKDGELDPGDMGLPWAAKDIPGEHPGQAIIVGDWARELGEKTPGRLVTSAKSWLSHTRVDRNAAILPWGTNDDKDAITRISPVQASACFLHHVKAAWNHQFPDHPLEQQAIVITIPASFDEGARALTLEAAREAGLTEIKLLEEPQAACYDWLHSHDQLPANSHLLLICDVGGGTTDLTLIKIDRHKTGPELERIGVGNHLMLGGDNMDLALAHKLEQQAGNERLNYARLSQLLQQTRIAKEELLQEGAPQSRNVTILAGGSKLLAGAKSMPLERRMVEDLVVEGYFPEVELAHSPAPRRSAIVEFGLPFESEPAITRHLAEFILRHQHAMAQALGLNERPEEAIIPDSVLLNGGVFNANPLRKQVLSQLAAWRGENLTELADTDPNHAVARGAVVYSLAQRGQGKKIGGGSARSYYLKLNANSASNTRQPDLICLLPKGAPEDTHITLPDREFALTLGNPVRFDLLASTADTIAQVGELVDAEDVSDLIALPPLATVLSTGQQNNAHNLTEARVTLQSELTEIGTLAVSCIDATTHQQWLLDFQLRGSPTDNPQHTKENSVAATDTAALRHPKLDQALGLIDALYGKARAKPNPKLIKTVRNDLEKLLGKRHDWDIAMIRELLDRLLPGQVQRRRSVAHERIWLNLTGFCLRPGYGSDLDMWRIEQLEQVYKQGIIHPAESQVWAEWWTLWRRVAGGLDDAMQASLLKDIEHYLHPAVAHSRVRMAELQKRAYNEMVRLLGSLEGLEPDQKREAGGWLLKRLEKPAEPEQTWWALGRLGARVPFHGNTHKALDATTAETWLEQLFKKDWQKEKTAAFAATLIARHSGDRELDISPACQTRVRDKLQASRCPPSWIKTVSERVELDQDDAKRVFGEALPQGLRLL